MQSKQSKVFRNELSLSSCKDCPRRKGRSSEGDKCCAEPIGLFESDFNLESFKCKNYKINENEVAGLGIHKPMSESNALWKRGQSSIPCGTQTLGKSPIGFIEGVAPKYLRRGKGGRVWDVDGNQYIDCWLACLPVTFGHNIKEIDDAIVEQLKDGIAFSMMHPLEVEVAEMLREDISIAEQVRFAKNGSDVCEAGVRLARHLTGRDKIITCGYHGFHDWYIGSTDRGFGIPEVYRDLTLRTDYNNLDNLKSLFDANKGEIACLMMEPALFAFPDRDYLKEVKEYVHSQGALLIFDEMLTGYRFSTHGAMDYFGVTPDLATFGKGIANGMPIGIIAGPEKHMRGFEQVFLSSTYGGDAVTLAAVKAGLEYHRKNNVVLHMWRIGKIVLDGFNNAIESRGLEERISAIGYPVRQTLTFKNANGEPDFDLAGLYQQEMLKRGILCNAGLGFCHMHSDNDAMYVVRSFAETLDVIGNAIDGGDLKKFLEGKPAQPVFKGLRQQKVTSN